VSSTEQPVDSLPATRPRTVLLVEDDPQVREVARTMLEGAGHRVIEAESTEDAIEQFGGMESLDLLVSDLTMPGMSGFELFDRLAERLPSLRVVFISGSASAADLETSARKGAPLLEKPFSADTLASTIREVLSSDMTRPPIEQAMAYISRARELLITTGDVGPAGPALKAALDCLMEARAERDYLRARIARLEVERDEQGED
jgi:CheY-like chemotaxis protein